MHVAEFKLCFGRGDCNPSSVFDNEDGEYQTSLRKWKKIFGHHMQRKHRRQRLQKKHLKHLIKWKNNLANDATWSPISHLDSVSAASNIYWRITGETTLI